jgi:hypothetical protein
VSRRSAEVHIPNKQRDTYFALANPVQYIAAGPRQHSRHSWFGTHDEIFVRSKIVYAFGNGISSPMRGGIGLSEQSPHLLHRNCARVLLHSRSVQVKPFVYYGHHTRRAIVLQSVTFMCQWRLLQQILLSLRNGR